MVQTLAKFNEIKNLELENQIRSILNSIKGLSPEEQKKKRAELEKIRIEKGEEAVQDFLIKQFKLN